MDKYKVLAAFMAAAGIYNSSKLKDRIIPCDVEALERAGFTRGGELVSSFADKIDYSPLNKKYGAISLGCDKNRVDSERMLFVLSKYGKITPDASEAQVLLVNTCAFLESARREAIDTVLEYAAYKTQNAEKLVVSGCLPKKYISDIFTELPEVDVFLGTDDYELLPTALLLSECGYRVNAVGLGKNRVNGRYLTTEHFAYLKIADGCDNRCTYCLIPSIRGKYRSEKIEDLVAEAASLGDMGELILVAQDITRYGVDLYGESRLVELLRALTKLENIGSLRLLYCYPEMVTDELIAEIKDNDKIIKYIDIPLQHASDRILKLMNRRGTRIDYEKLINKLRAAVPNIAIRSTFIAGFPGETEEDYKILLSFIEENKLTNAGFFAYSDESEAPSYKLRGKIDEAEKDRRVKGLYDAQYKNIVVRNDALVGKTLSVVCDGVDYDGDGFYGRAYFSAPEIDSVIYLSGSLIEQGKRYEVEITENIGYDLKGRIIE